MMKKLVALIIIGLLNMIVGSILFILFAHLHEILGKDSVMPNLIFAVSNFNYGDYVLILLSLGLTSAGLVLFGIGVFLILSGRYSQRGKKFY